MTDKELLETFQVELCIFHGDLIERDGFYEPEFRVVYINSLLDEKERHRVLLHELGHMTHNPINYQRLLVKYENEADRFMVRTLLEEELAQYDVVDFNWLQFAQRHKISTTWGESMIQEEFRKIVGV